MTGQKSLKDLQTEWYDKLKAEGFIDIESKNKALIEWHSFKFTSQRFQIIQASRAQYQKQIDDFRNHPAFTEACKSMVKHGNSKFTELEVELIWTLHTEGETTRDIASKVQRVKSRIDDIIRGLRQWMRLV